MKKKKSRSGLVVPTSRGQWLACLARKLKTLKAGRLIRWAVEEVKQVASAMRAELHQNSTAYWLVLLMILAWYGIGFEFAVAFVTPWLIERVIARVLPAKKKVSNKQRLALSKRVFSKLVMAKLIRETPKLQDSTLAEWVVWWVKILLVQPFTHLLFKSTSERAARKRKP